MPIQVKTIEDAARLYRKIESSLAEKEAVYKKTIEKQVSALKQLEVVMRALLNQQGVASVNIPDVAEVKIVDKRTFGNDDWDSFWTWMVANNVPELLQKKIHEGNMQYWIDHNPGIMPPGVTVYTEHILKILKGK